MACEKIGLKLPPADRLAQAYPDGWAPRGVIIGDVEIWGHVVASTNPWFFGRFGFQLHNQRAWPKPVPARGMLGFWEWKGELGS